MRKIINIAFTAMLLLNYVIAEENGWSWGQDEKNVPPEGPAEPQHEEQHVAESEYNEETISGNSTEAQEIIDEILTSKRQGRNLEGFDEVYSDPSVQEALQKGDDGEARNIIKDRLCHLGLMQCEEDIRGKRPYISPEELVYAQPVAINPVGQPIPTIPVKSAKGIYGPPRPVPFPPGKFGPQNKFGPPPPHKPPRRGYGPPIPPSRPFYGPPSKPFIGDHEIYDGQEFLSKPPPEFLSKPPSFVQQPIEPNFPPYQFEQGLSHSAHHNDKKVEVVVNGEGVQKHVHHHFHHNADGIGSKAPTVLVNPIPVATAAAVSSSSLNSFGGSTFGSQQSLYKPTLSSSGFTPISSSFGSSGSGGSALTIGGGSFGSAGSGGSGLTIGGGSFGGSYGGQTIANYGGSSPSLGHFGNIKPISEDYGSNSYGGLNSFGASVGSYGSSGLYKKELTLNSNSINSNYLQSNYADKYQGLESARAENYDCICVPYDQCPSHDIIGRKDDLYLALDPRNLKSDIEAISEEERVITDGNGTMTVVRVPKGASLNETKEEDVKKVSKREAPTQENDASKAKVEPRQYGSNNNKKVKPTFGISFGLPNQGGGGYPINPHGPNPLVNPYGNSVGGQGINLGLVSVNPLISLQVTKDDYGEKVLKPFVNLHVTPNNYLVHKFEDLLSHKKHVIFNKHKHFHLHKPNYHHPHHDDHSFHGPPGPIYHHEPDHYPHASHHYHPEPDHHHYGPGPGPEYDSPPPDFYKGPEFGHGGPGFGHGGPEFGHGGPEFGHGGPEFGHGGPEFGHGGPISHHNPQQSYYDNPYNYGGHDNHDYFHGRAYQNNTNLVQGNSLLFQLQQQYENGQNIYGNNNSEQPFDNYLQDPQTDNHNFANSRGGKSLSSSNPIKFPSSRKRRDVTEIDKTELRKRQAPFGNFGRPATCGPRHVCCRRPVRPQIPTPGRRQCGTRHSQGINGRIKNPVYVDGDSEFGEYPWQVAILKKDPKESVYVCGGTLIDALHIVTAAHCIKTYTGFDLRVRLGEWDVNHDVEFFPYVERDVTSVTVHPEFYAGTLYNDIAVVRMDKPVDFSKYPHISPACLPNPYDDYTGTRCWTTGWGKDAFGDFGKYQNILKEVDVPIMNHGVCQRQLQQTRLGYEFKLHPGFVCAGGEEGKDACKGDGGGPMVCERGGTWQVVGIVSWGIGCGQVGVPGVYVNVAHYLDWIRQVTQIY